MEYGRTKGGFVRIQKHAADWKSSDGLGLECLSTSEKQWNIEAKARRSSNENILRYEGE